VHHLQHRGSNLWSSCLPQALSTTKQGRNMRTRCQEKGEEMSCIRLMARPWLTAPLGGGRDQRRGDHPPRRQCSDPGGCFLRG
jgi:hypothetical protein